MSPRKINRTGVPWRYLPHGFPAHATASPSYAAWRDEGILTRLGHTLTRRGKGEQSLVRTGAGLGRRVLVPADAARQVPAAR